jgi:hypothetical protein
MTGRAPSALFYGDTVIKHSRFGHPAERLMHLTVVSMLDGFGETPPEALALLEAAVAEVFMGDPSGWSVESLERLLDGSGWLERTMHRAGIGAEAPSVEAVREMVAKYRIGQRTRFGCSAPTPLWPWLEINMAGETDGERVGQAAGVGGRQKA